jgi:hypothetical protein
MPPDLEGFTNLLMQIRLSGLKASSRVAPAGWELDIFLVLKAKFIHMKAGRFQPQLPNS